jgi:hypothetical protein
VSFGNDYLVEVLLSSSSNNCGEATTAFHDSVQKRTDCGTHADNYGALHTAGPQKYKTLDSHFVTRGNIVHANIHEEYIPLLSLLCVLCLSSCLRGCVNI